MTTPYGRGTAHAPSGSHASPSGAAVARTSRPAQACSSACVNTSAG